MRLWVLEGDENNKIFLWLLSFSVIVGQDESIQEKLGGMSNSGDSNRTVVTAHMEAAAAVQRVSVGKLPVSCSAS